MKRKVLFSLAVLFLFITGAVIYAQDFYAGNIAFDIDAVDFMGSFSQSDFLSLTGRNEMRSLETALQQNVFRPAGLRLTSFNSRNGNAMTSLEREIVQWLLDNNIPLNNHKVGDTYRIITSRSDQWTGYVIVFNRATNGLWNYLMFSFTAQ